MGNCFLKDTKFFFWNHDKRREGDRKRGNEEKVDEIKFLQA